MVDHVGRREDALHLEQLRRDFLANEPGADDRLARALEKELRGFLKKSSYSDASDIIQETLLHVWKKLPDFEPEGPASFRNWVRVLAYHFTKKLRQKKVAWISEAARLPDPQPSPLRWTIERERERRLSSAIAKLSTMFARAIAFVLGGGKVKDHAATDKLPLSTAYWRVDEARRRLRRMLRTLLET